MGARRLLRRATVTIFERREEIAVAQHGVALGKTSLEETPPESQIVQKQGVRRIVQQGVVQHANDEAMYSKVIEQKSLRVEHTTRLVGPFDQ